MAKKQSQSVKNKGKISSREIVGTGNETKSGIFDYFRFGESYTSLILGIVVVIIATVLLLSLLHGRNSNKGNMQTTLKGNENAQNIAAQSTPSASIVPTATAEATFTPVPTKAVPIATPTVVKKVTPTKAPIVTPTAVQTKAGTIYTVEANDSLWKIAEKKYKSGYNWVDIARANNLTNPGVLSKGMKLTLPDISPKVATVKPAEKTQQVVVETNKITSDTYKVVKGDSLWTIAVRAYGDGYRWVAIAKANNLTNPSIIHAQNTLKIPRGK